ncbi:hypothetical protein EPJ65_12355 [Brachyspira aalborgi]|uniref:hypothetical protein n=1 Tax=Brachyspira aalborgi TaxID=29522 RepID=UPI0011C74633|nr:hypothetical protein [Brachyspira aalborgi]TXJ40028.1 hypothetical protein EPJ65_12355 [Brachyspira aalborgi]
MQRNGITQDITVLPVNSQPIMVVQIGSGENIELIRWGIDTIIEYYFETTELWNEAKVLSPSSVKDEKTQEVVNLQANTPVRLKENPTTSGLLVLSTKMYDIEYNAEDLQTTYQFLYGSGIVKDKLYGNIIASGGRQITVSSSQFVIDGFVGFFKSPQSVIVDIGDGSVRKDLLILRKVQAEGDVYLCIKRGIPSPNPEPPKLTQNTNGIYEIALAEISVQANSQTISQGDIKDVRPTGFLSIINMMYPIGSIYISLDKDFDPNNTWQGTKWELLEEGLFIEATQNNSQVGIKTPAGLPDITGTTSSHVGNNVYLWNNTDGAFYSDEIIDAYDPVYDDNIKRAKTKKIRFSASRSNIIYGRSNTVQPHSIRCFIWQRTK